MGLVEYPSSSSSSDDDDNEEHAPPSKRRRLSADTEPSALPPLPQSFRDLYSTPARLSLADDPSLHGGRQRIVPHISGNWSAHVYLEWNPSPSESTLLSSLVTQVRSQHKNTTSLLTDSLSVALPLHISLSAPLVLRTETKDAFRTAMLSALSTIARNHRPPLVIAPRSLAWFANAERTRAFLVLRVADPSQPSEINQGPLAKLLEASNAVALRFGCRALYAGDDGEEGDAMGAFHISLAWSLGADEALDESALAAGSRLAGLLERAKGIRIAFSEVKLRLGKEVSSVPFGRGRRGETSMLG